jgi:hypothetical protein
VQLLLWGFTHRKTCFIYATLMFPCTAQPCFLNQAQFRSVFKTVVLTQKFFIFVKIFINELPLCFSRKGDFEDFSRLFPAKRWRYGIDNNKNTCAGIFKQTMGARETSKNRVVILARRATQPGGISTMESILGLLKSYKFGL